MTDHINRALVAQECKQMKNRQRCEEGSTGSLTVDQHRAEFTLVSKTSDTLFE